VEGQQFPSITLSPPVLYAGAGPTVLHIDWYQSQSSGWSLRWNGTNRPLAGGTSSGAFPDLALQLTAEDLASPGSAEVSVVDPVSGLVVASRTVYIGYNVVPNDIVFDRVHNRFYLTTRTQSNDSRFPANSLVVLDGSTLVPGAVLAIGTYPTSLALTDDGKWLYVAVDGDGVVRRVNLETFTVASEFRLRAPISFFGGNARSAVAAMPGNPLTVAVYYAPDTQTSGTSIAIFDDGQKRASLYTFTSGGYDGLLFAPDGHTLFLGSFNHFYSPQSVLRYTVDASGIPKQEAQSAAGGGPVIVQNGILYTSQGTLVESSSMQVKGVLGVGGALAVDASNQRILVAYTLNTSTGSNVTYLQAFDSSTQVALGWITLDNPADVLRNYPGERLIRFGADGVLYTSENGILLFRTPLAGPAPATAAAAIVNSASQRGGSIAPGEILSVYGSKLGPATPVPAQLSSLGLFPATLSSVQAWFDQTPGTVLLAYDSQVNVIAPFEIQPGQTVNFQLWYCGIPTARIPLTVAAAAPGLYTRSGSGSGAVAVVNQDGTVNTPAPAGSYVTLFGTGAGGIAGVKDGGVARSAQRLSGTVRVTIGGREASVLYAGSAPLLVNGLFQLNVQVPADTPSGMAPVTVTINGQDSPKGATLEIR
jgi:uncharacterized protein (TIGR03437 family)